MERQAVEDLKKDWITDPCWDLEETEGFEAYYQELLAFRKRIEEAARIKQEREVEDKARALNCSVDLVNYIETLEYKIEMLSSELDALKKAQPIAHADRLMPAA